MKTLQQQLAKVSLLQSKKVLMLIAEAGEKENNKMSDEINNFAKLHPDSNPLFITIAVSLFWAGYLKEDHEVISLVVNYFEKGDSSSIDGINEYLKKTSKKGAKTTLQGWKALLSTSMPIPQIETVDDLIMFQKTISNRAFDLFQSNKTMGVGAWFCYAPLLGIALLNKNFWKEDKLDEFIPPLGFQVKRGFEWLSHKYPLDNFPTFQNYSDAKYESLNLTRNSLSSQQELAKQAKSRVIHINTGLWLLGSKKCTSNI